MRLFRQQLILLFCETLNVNFFTWNVQELFSCYWCPWERGYLLLQLHFRDNQKLPLSSDPFHHFISLLLCGKGMRFGKFKTTYLYFSKFVLTAVQFKYEVNHMKFYYSWYLNASKQGDKLHEWFKAWALFKPISTFHTHNITAFKDKCSFKSRLFF